MNRAAFSDVLPRQEASPPFSLREFLHRYVWRYRFFFAGALGLMLTVAALYLRYASPQYLVRATLLIKTPEVSSNGVSEEVILQDLGLSQDAKNLENEMQILRSRSLMEDVVRRQALHITYFSEGRVRRKELYRQSPIQVDSFFLEEEAYGAAVRVNDLPGQGRFRWIEGGESLEFAYGQWFATALGAFRLAKTQPGPLSFRDLIIRIGHPEDVAAAYAKRLNVQVVGGFSSVLELSLKDPVPARGKAVLNGLVAAYNRAAVADKNRVGQNTLAFIDERLRLLTAELAGVEEQVEAYKTENDLPVDATSEAARRLSKVASVEEERSRLHIRMQVLTSLMDYLQQPEHAHALIPLAGTFGSDRLGELIAAYNRGLLEREEISRSAESDNPALLRMDARLESEREVIGRALEARQLQWQKELRILRENQRENLAWLRSIPRRERELVELQRQQTIKANLYLYLLEKREETALSMAVAIPNSRLIDPARSTKKPVAPNPDLLYALACFLGLAVPGVAILLRELLNDRVQSEEDIRRATAMPLLGGVTQQKRSDRLLVHPHSDAPAAEMFRLLRTRLGFHLKREGPAVVLVSSAMSGEGKTFVATNLAAGLAMADRRTVAVELDLRKPRLERYLLNGQAPARSKGVSYFLAGRARLEDIVQAQGQEGLFYIPSGPTPPNPAELINSRRMCELIRALKSRFDFVLLDTPPIGLVTDGLLLAAHADASLFIVRYGQTRKRALHLLEELYQDQTFSRPAIVTNGRQPRGEYGYLYAYGRY
jgi:capsular exopolysaccharide synthesis family protein